MQTYLFSHEFSSGIQNYFLVKSTQELSIPSLGGLNFPAHAVILSGINPDYTEDGIWANIYSYDDQDTYLFFIQEANIEMTVNAMNENFQKLVLQQDEALFTNFLDGNIVIGVKKVPLGMIVCVNNQTNKTSPEIIEFLFPNNTIVHAGNRFESTPQWEKLNCYFCLENFMIEKKFWKPLRQHAQAQEGDFIKFCKKQFKANINKEVLETYS